MPSGALVTSNFRYDTSGTPNTVPMRDGVGGIGHVNGTFSGFLSVGQALYWGNGTSGTVSVTGAYAILGTELVVKASAAGGAFNVTLPNPATYPNRLIAIIKTDAGGNAVTVLPFAAETINGAASKVISAAGGLKFWTDGTNWYTI